MRFVLTFNKNNHYETEFSFMKMTKLVEYFNTHFDYITKSIFNFAIWADSVDVDVCSAIASQLELIADKTNDPDAAALYALICAYDNHDGTFSPDTACRLIFEHDAVEAYRELLREKFADILDEFHYEELDAFPAIQLMKSFANGDS